MVLLGVNAGTHIQITENNLHGKNLLHDFTVHDDMGPYTFRRRK